MLEKLLRIAMGSGLAASCMMVVDKRNDSLFARFGVVLMFCVSFYYWIRYLKAYIDQRIKMRDDLEKTD
jgi:lipopolysaccharide export LptBFGC system permease protein LptF